jgi:hypothetical protein
MIGTKKKKVQFTYLDNLYYVTSKLLIESYSELEVDQQFKESIEEIGFALIGSMTEILDMLCFEIVESLPSNWMKSQRELILETYKSFSRKVTTPTFYLDQTFENLKKLKLREERKVQELFNSENPSFKN